MRFNWEGAKRQWMKIETKRLVTTIGLIIKHSVLFED